MVSSADKACRCVVTTLVLLGATLLWGCDDPTPAQPKATTAAASATTAEPQGVATSSKRTDSQKVAVDPLAQLAKLFAEAKQLHGKPIEITHTFIDLGTDKSLLARYRSRLPAAFKELAIFHLVWPEYGGKEGTAPLIVGVPKEQLSAMEKMPKRLRLKGTFYLAQGRGATGKTFPIFAIATTKIERATK